MKISSSPVTKFSTFAALLVNFSSCFLDNHALEKFDYEALLMDEYLSLKDY